MMDISLDLLESMDKAHKAAKKRVIEKEQARAADVKRPVILQALAQAKNIQEAADIAGVSRKTIYTYMNNDTEFIAAYRDIKRAQLRDIADAINQGAKKAVSYIAELLDDTEASPAVKLSAAVKLLELGAKYKSIETEIDRSTLGELTGFSIGNTTK